MRKVSSAPSLTALEAGHTLPKASGVSMAGAKLAPKSIFGTTGPLKASYATAPGNSKRDSRGDALKTEALIYSDAPVALPSTAAQEAQVAYAIASKGFLTATECLASIEMEEAPPLTGAPGEASARMMDVASCMATPVVPDRTNAEIIAGQATKLADEAERQLRMRFAHEISTNFSSRPINAPRLRRLLSRKRSLDDLDLDAFAHAHADIGIHPDITPLSNNQPPNFTTANKNNSSKRSMGPASSALLGSGDGNTRDIGFVSTGGGGGSQPTASPETKRLLALQLGTHLEEEHHHQRNKLHLHQHPITKAVTVVDLAELKEPDHKFLLGEHDFQTEVPTTYTTASSLATATIAGSNTSLASLGMEGVFMNVTSGGGIGFDDEEEANILGNRGSGAKDQQKQRQALYRFYAYDDDGDDTKYENEPAQKESSKGNVVAFSPRKRPSPRNNNNNDKVEV